MIFKKGYLYHIYNQGNNRQNIFYNRENYLFFLKKIKIYILPYADVLAWCLMPNHFHLMVRVNRIITQSEGFIKKKEIAFRDTQSQDKSLFIHRMAKNRSEYSHPMNTKSRTFNTSIAIMLRSFTRAINKQENWTGSLFRKETKAECINCFKGVKPSFIQSGISITNLLEEKQYPQVCFNYIHQNPVKANFVENAADWEFSSAKDYARLRNGNLINRTIASEYIDF